MALMNINGFECEVVSIAEFARGPDGTCAFCKGDPCNEDPVEGSVISQFYAQNKWADTCPCCDGRPT